MLFFKKNSQYDPMRINAFQCDVTQDKLTTNVRQESVDIVTVIFVMSSISPDKMQAVLQNISTVSFSIICYQEILRLVVYLIHDLQCTHCKRKGFLNGLCNLDNL